MEIPNTTVECDGCGDDLNLLGVHLVVQVKPQRQVLVVEDMPAANGNEESTEQRVSLGSRKGRGVQKWFHNFSCAQEWFAEREDYEPKIQLVVEDEIFVPEENRTVEEIAEAGEG